MARGRTWDGPWDSPLYLTSTQWLLSRQGLVLPRWLQVHIYSHSFYQASRSKLQLLLGSIKKLPSPAPSGLSLLIVRSEEAHV